MSVLDAVLPEYAHSSRYERVVQASPETTWAALRGLTDDELPLTRLLVAARSMSLAAALGSGRPVVDAFLARGFSLLRDDPPRALVAGAAGQPWRIRGGEIVSASAARWFRLYWTVVRIGSDTVRLDLLRALRGRAESAGARPPPSRGRRRTRA